MEENEMEYIQKTVENATLPVFVYGTLMRGQRANHMLAGAAYAGEFTLEDHAMYDLGRYPGIVPRAGETVFGEVFFVSEEMLAKMDEYEEEGSLYRRVAVRLRGEKGALTAQAYIYNRDVTGCRLLRCPWSARTQG
jgi:gamma-glutamylcyclotransferase (GGCT)/AIG2-like uncharacterized protein YtfP